MPPWGVLTKMTLLSGLSPPSTTPMGKKAIAKITTAGAKAFFMANLVTIKATHSVPWRFIRFRSKCPVQARRTMKNIRCAATPPHTPAQRKFGGSNLNLHLALHPLPNPTPALDLTLLEGVAPPGEQI